MSSPKLTNRREFLRLSTLTTVGAALVAACAPAVPPTPTPVPATATSATKPDAAATTAPAPTTQPAPKPTEAPKPAAATAAPQAGAKGKVIWDTFRGVGTTWPEDRIRAFEKANEGWTVEFRPIPIPGGQGDAYPKMYAMFAAGKLAIIHGGTWHILNAHMAIKDEKAAVVRTALFPKRKDGIRPSQSRVGTWNVGAKSKSPEAAWKFVQTLTSREGVLNFTMFGQGIALVRPDIMNHPYFSHPGFRVYLENLLTAMPSTVPANGRGTELTQTFNQRWAEVYLAKTPFEQGMKALHESIQRVLDKPAD